MKSLTEQVHEYICKNDTQFSSEELANMVRYFTQEQAKEIEVLKQSYEILFKHRIAQEKEIEQFRFVLRNLTLATSKKIGDLEAELEDCTCQG